MKKNFGFSLIELSIVILVLSIVSVSVLTLFSRKNLSDKNNETRQKLETITQALKLYYKAKDFADDGLYNGTGYLPCPSGLDKTAQSTQFGSGATSGTGTAGCSYELATAAGNILSGGVPILELGLSPQYFFDSWGNRITYIVDGDLTANWTGTSMSNIRILNKSDVLITTRKVTRAELGTSFTDCAGTSFTVTDLYTDDIADCPAVLVMSHGSNGLFSYNFAGTAQKTTSFGMSNYEKKNGPNNNSFFTYDAFFYDVDINQDNKDSGYTNYFDDIMVYKSMSYFKSN